VKHYGSGEEPILEAELGCAWGNMGEAYLTSLKGLDKGLYERMRLTLCDSSPSLLEAAAYNTQLMPHLEGGKVELTLLDVMRNLQMLSRPNGVFSHEIGDDLGTKTMVLKNGKVFEHEIRPVLKSGMILGEIDSQGRLTLGDPKKLQQIMCAGDFKRLTEFDFGFLKALRYDQRLRRVDESKMPYSDTLKAFLTEAGERVLVGVNTGFLSLLEGIHGILKPGGRYSFFDYGWGSIDDVREQQYAQVRVGAEGHITSDINFPLTLRVAERIGFRVVAVKTQQEFVSQALGEPALLVQSLLRAHTRFNEQDETMVRALLQTAEGIIDSHYKGLRRQAKARRYVEHNLRQEGKSPQECRDIIDVAERGGAFKHKAGRAPGNLDTGSYLLLSEVEPAFGELRAAGFNTDLIRQLFADDSFTRPMKYVVLEKTS